MQPIPPTGALPVATPAPVVAQAAQPIPAPVATATPEQRAALYDRFCHEVRAALSQEPQKTAREEPRTITAADTKKEKEAEPALITSLSDIIFSSTYISSLFDDTQYAT